MQAGSDQRFRPVRTRSLSSLRLSTPTEQMRFTLYVPVPQHEAAYSPLVLSELVRSDRLAFTHVCHAAWVGECRRPPWMACLLRR